MEAVQTLKKSRAQKSAENRARYMIQKFEIPSGIIRNVLMEKYYVSIFKEVKKYPPSLLGKLAVTGKAYGIGGRGISMYTMHCGTWLDKYGSGRSLLQQIVATAIIAKVYDLCDSLY